MSNATPHQPPAPMIAVEAVLNFRASCTCGWWRILETEERAIGALAAHQLDTRCDGCTEAMQHDDAIVEPQGAWAGTFCVTCAVHYAAA